MALISPELVKQHLDLGDVPLAHLDRRKQRAVASNVVSHKKP